MEIAIASNKLENDKMNIEKLQELKSLCYLTGSEPVHDILEPYSWLSLWLKEKNIEDITRGELYSEIENGDWDDDEFWDERDND